MKDTSSTTRHPRPAAYPKKRPSPHGVTKSHKTPLLPPVARRAPLSAKSAMLAQRQRAAQLIALRKEGVFIEEEYREEIQDYMHELERYTVSSTQSMDQQPEIKWHMRPCLVDFLVEIHFTFRLRPETLYLTLNIVDRYVSRRIVYIKHYQLVGCAALWIAAKFEDAKERVPTVQDLAQICRDTYDESAFIQMEGHVLATIQWTLGHPTAEAWLRLMCCGPTMEDAKVQHVARFLMEITLFYREFVQYSPSAIALGALTLARALMGKGQHDWPETDESMEVVEHLDNRLAKNAQDLSETLIKKYSYAFYSKAATFVLQFYLTGGRYMPAPLVATLPMAPVTPSRSKNVSAFSTPTSASTSASEDDYPLTPTSPMSFASSDPFSSHGYSSDNDKENLPTTFEPVVNKQRIDQTPDQYLPHDFVQFGRSTLHNLNISSPRTMAP
ncbi:hypothetical protein FIBSPDRAFT_755552 [Athelia psychrophila]|uniref:Uncharacterized protein n=1 Tax=Athelia psychrophila TaxID=1759441 RepID=A0A166AXG9_9AGAM|nr:hypothetical protein FIBSPDRAFT_755552 [Fibularhizoctonia sp. CBS 109695]